MTFIGIDVVLQSQFHFVWRCHCRKCYLVQWPDSGVTVTAFGHRAKQCSIRTWVKNPALCGFFYFLSRSLCSMFMYLFARKDSFPGTALYHNFVDITWTVWPQHWRVCPAVTGTALSVSPHDKHHLLPLVSSKVFTLFGVKTACRY